MLPQGMFSVAVATVLFPRLARLASRHDLDGLRATTGTGMRQIALLLIPSAAATVALATPIVQLVYQRGEFDAESTRLTSEALLWFAFSPALLGHQPAAHADVLLAAAAVAADGARAGLAGGQRRRLARAVRAAGARRRRAGDDGGQRRDDGAAGDPPAAGAGRPGGGPHAAGGGDHARRVGAARRRRLRHVVGARRPARATRCPRSCSPWAPGSPPGAPCTPPCCCGRGSPRRARSSTCSGAGCAAPNL